MNREDIIRMARAIELALEALEEIHPGNMTPIAEEAWNKAITALREALAEQPAQQPTNCRHCGGAANVICAGQCKEQPAQQQEPVARCMEHGECFGGECIYTSPPASKPWVGLTQEDRLDIWKKSSSIDGAINATASKLREKNNG